MKPRTLIWFSTGAASAVMTQLMLREDRETAIVVRCETGNEDPDNYRFEADVMRHLNTSITVLKSDEFDNVRDVWKRERYMAGINGASCTRAMKVEPRLAFQHPTDRHAFGYTADKADKERFKRLQENYPELVVRAPLIEQGINKANCLGRIERWGIALPRSYAMGFPNANCLQSGCVKGGLGYWSRYRHYFPEAFAKTAAQAREIGARLVKYKGERIFIDEIPADYPMIDATLPACDFLCHLAEAEPVE
jgi:hypothetical protein